MEDTYQGSVLSAMNGESYLPHHMSQIRKFTTNTLGIITMNHRTFDVPQLGSPPMLVNNCI
jgi:hypothetical protein